MGNAKRPNDRNTSCAGVDIFETLVAMKLRGGKMQAVREGDHRGGLPIHKNSDGGDEGWQATDDFPGDCGRHSAAAFFVKNKSEGVGSELAGELGVLRVGDAADFDQGHGGLRPLGGSAKKCVECSGRIRRAHQVFSNEKGVEAS